MPSTVAGRSNTDDMTPVAWLRCQSSVRLPLDPLSGVRAPRAQVRCRRNESIDKIAQSATKVKFIRAKQNSPPVTNKSLLHRSWHTPIVMFEEGWEKGKVGGGINNESRN